MDDYASIVWILRGLVGSAPAVMALRNGPLSLATEDVLIFGAPLANVREVRFPWYYFWGAMKMKVNDALYRISFVQPNNVPPVHEPALLNSATIVPLVGAVRNPRDVTPGFAAGKRWRSIFRSSH